MQQLISCFRVVDPVYPHSGFENAMPDSSALSVTDPASCWEDVMKRNAAADGTFVYAVRTTGIYCRPSCPARRPRRENVSFHASSVEAEKAGYRACQRCHPQGASRSETNAARVMQACRLIEQSERSLTLEELAGHVGLSPFHFHRQFKAVTGLTPKAYTAAHRMRKVRESLTDKGMSVTQAIYEAGFNSASRFYEQSDDVLGMTPRIFREGGSKTMILFAVRQCSLGAILVACSSKGICAVALGDDPATLAHDLQDRFPQADLVAGDADFERLVTQVIGCVEVPQTSVALPLDIRGTAFQQRVWQALRDIPAGRTASYTEIAHRIGQPGSVRAVARACGANTLAVVIPCHRVVRTDGALAGYRWGIDRKRALLDRESED